MLNNHEIENLEDKIIMTLRRNGSYSVPKSSLHVYTPIIAVLEKMNDDGLVIKSDGLNKIIFTATEQLSPTVIVRGITADKVRTGFHLCVQKNDKIVARVNARNREVYAKDVDFLGVVCSVETKEVPANIWEKLTFQKNSVKTVIRFKYKTLVVDPTMELMKVR
jgi:hypothetical protein